ncbi:hypothetical protein [Hymenobacter cheonanensis]|nr:hypothetical protein [Hymenobacter sp. CA2-7]MDO7885090.1 hypothetical protein [Hymenobacter sp. CA2-7]
MRAPSLFYLLIGGASLLGGCSSAGSFNAATSKLESEVPADCS